MKTGVLVGYFVKRNEAREAYRKLLRKGFRRVAWVGKGADGRVETHEPLSIAGRLWRSKFGVERNILKNHARWLSANETVLIVRGSLESLRRPFDLLIESGDVPPAIFVLHPRLEGEGEAGSVNTGAPLNSAQLKERAERLAAENRLTPKPLRGTTLLRRLERGRRRIQQICMALSDAGRLQQGVPPVAEWLLDNEYIIESAARDVSLNLPRSFYRQLPSLANEPDRGLPRIYSLARELASHTDLRLDDENVVAFIEAYQGVKPLSIGELWVVPQMLRMVLLDGIGQVADRAMAELRERESADFWANRLITASRRDPGQIFAVLAELTEAKQSPSPYFAVQLMDYLYDEGTVLAPVQGWLERTFNESLNELGLRVSSRQAKDRLSVGNAFISLRQLALLDWKECFERVSLVERTLKEDPAGIYPRMDFATRDRYRGAVEELHRGSGLSEDEVARRVIEVAAEAGGDDEKDELPLHIGTYLVGDGRKGFSDGIGCRETLRFRFLRWAYRNHTAVYLLGVALFSAAFVYASLRIGFPACDARLLCVAAMLLVVPASQVSIEVLNYLVMRIFPPRTLPKMDFKDEGIPDACRTLVVVPMMLTDAETVVSELEKLEVRYLANSESNLLFGLFSDYTDADEEHAETDEPLLRIATQGIESLNDRYGGGRFFLFHRERRWCDSERKFIGWERKRGKLEELNGLIDGTRAPDAERLIYVGDPGRLENVRYVITLDSDTQLPHDAARRMVETLAHPLNRARIDGDGLVRSGYTIIQPRVSPSLPSTGGSPFSRLFSDPVGIDPYTSAVSDAYQDLAGAGSYHGKGIYDVRAFNRVLAGRFPESLLLSHDLIEGAHVRVGLASDIELYDEFPQDYISYAKRQHRWVRGDWQIADWFTRSVPLPGGGRGANPLSLFDRWKIFDNLRRSLLAATGLSLMLLSWFVSQRAGIVATSLVAAQLLFHSIAQPVTWATTGQGWKGVPFARKVYDLLRSLVEAALLPYSAWLSLDAAARVFYRKHVSRRGLLEWTSAQVAHGSAQAKVPIFVSSLGLSSLFGLGVGWALLRFRPESLPVALVWLALWIFSPLVGWLVNRRPKEMAKRFLLEEDDRRFMRTLARRTWRYFSDFVDEETSWLPPDNYQVAYQNRLALRTSPTNIGLYMVSVLGAHDFGYVTVDQVEDRLSRTMETIGKLERHEGHLLNWYDIRTLAPLNPRYVSTVDSGNLLGSLWTLDQGLQALLRTPLLNARAFEGLKDSGNVLQQIIIDKKHTGFDDRGLGERVRSWGSLPSTVAETLSLLRQTGQGDLSKRLSGSAAADESVTYWIGQIESQLAEWRSVADRYLAWIEILGEKSAEQIAELDPAAVPAFREAMGLAPSIQDLALGNIPFMAALEGLREKAAAGEGALLNWIDRVAAALEKARWFAGEKLALVEGLLRSVRELSESINMRFLYNAERRLFSIGYNVSEGRLDRAFYDLLASEARLGSFVAIARGDVPVEHWFAMGRPYGAVGRQRVLLSWTGTMFEYLMPLLFQHTWANSLLNKSTRDAVKVQMDYGLKHRVPWGISECAFGDLDVHKTHQYSAFGVPDLGLKRDLSERIVVAPYATMLAIDIAPRESVNNLRRMAALGLLTDYGYYEALDFSGQTSRGGERGVTVRAFMAHHQGMGFLALANFLNDGSVRRHFHADLRVRATEPLLQERVPNVPPLHHVSTRERVSSVASVGDVTPAVSQFETPHTTNPKTQLLCNGRYGVMVTNSGGGYSRWNGFDITRWRSDRTRDSWGTFCYIRDADSGRLWCNSYHPTGGDVGEYLANFTLDRAMYRRVDHGIEVETEVVVAPEDDVEIRRMTIINRSSRRRRLDLTSYVELSLAPHGADLKHPAFAKLFVQTEALRGERALLACRRPRGTEEEAVFVAHRMTSDEAAGEEMRFETDRRRFIGRGRTLANPMGAAQEPGSSEGFVLDPILSLRRSLNLSPGQRTRVSLVLSAGASREDAVGLISRYGDPHAIDRAMDLAWGQAQLELRLMHIQPDDARCFQQLASHLLYPNPLLRSSAERIAQNRKGQAGLWAYSISGDLPVALVAVGETRDLGLVRQMLNAHNYWRTRGLMADLVILNEEDGGYQQPLREQLEHMVGAFSVATGVDKPGGVYLRSADLIPAEDLTLLRSVASVVVVAARGTLPQQLSAPTKAPELPAPIALRKSPKDPSAALPFMELPFFNSVGGFTTDGREYAIYLAPGINTPAPWVNVIANPSFGTMVSETGAGFTWAGNSQRNRLTPWSNDPVTDPPSEALYIRDDETGVFWTPTASPVREGTAYRARHGAGYTVFEHNSHGIEQELTVFVPVDGDGGQPIKLQRLSLKNDTDRPRRLSVTYYVELTLGECRESSQAHVVTDWDDEFEVLLARNFYNPDYADRVAFAAMSAPAKSYTGDRAAFIGRNRSMANPAAMERIRLSRRIGAGLDPCAAVQVEVRLMPGECAEVTCMLGEAGSVEQVYEITRTYRDHLAFTAALQETKEWWDETLGAVEVSTPELAVDFLVNRWLLYQSLSCRMWGRSAFYQSGGAFGFRDQLQDAMALLYACPGLAREQILTAAARQFKEGDVQHWWHPPNGDGVRTKISDDLLWLPFVTAHYVRVTGDVHILREAVPWLDAPQLKEDQHESLQTPAVSPEKSTLFEHCQRAVARAQLFGPRGLPLMGTGDWNDGMNLVGAGGKGESVWLAWFLAEVLRGMADMSELLGRSNVSRTYERDRNDLVRVVEERAWDGEWYIRATFDDGSPLGSSANAEARIDSLPQSWALLSGAADMDRAATAMESAWKYLVRENDGLVLLFDPPFDKAEPSPGYIKGYPPGVRENGGQYTHAALWFAMAMARMGDGTRAAKILRWLSPVERARDPETVWRYGVEPYAVAADVYSSPGWVGHGGWSWYTGSSAWMYRAWVEELLGLKVRGDEMRIDPVIPGWWDGFSMSYRHGEAVYEIQVENPKHCERGVAYVELDGRRLKGGAISLERDLVKHRVLVRMGKAKKSR